MDLTLDPSWGLNARFKCILEHVNRLQEANRQLEAQIADRGVTNTALPQDWSQQEQTVNELRAQVGKLLMENVQLALQSDSMKSRAVAIQARCETEERNTRRLEQQVDLLRRSKRKADQSSVALQADLRHSVTELREMHQEFEAARALQLHRAGSSDALRATASAAAAATSSAVGRTVEDGAGMEHSQLRDRIRTQSRLGPGAVADPLPGSAGPSRSGGAAAAAPRAHGHGVLSEEEGAWVQVRLGHHALREARDELAEARKQWRSLQVEMETLRSLERGLESSLRNTQKLYSGQLQDLSQVVAGLEGELQRVRSGLATQHQRHGRLLDTKLRLEQEIATYRRLLEREESRYVSRDGRPAPGPRPRRCFADEPKGDRLENGLGDSAVTPDEPRSEPLPEIPPLVPGDGGPKRGVLRRQQSLVILTEPGQDRDMPIATVRTREILQGNVVRESAEGHGTVETENIDRVIKQWEGSFFRGNPKLRKKSVSLRFDLHMAAADEGCAQTKQDSLPDVEVRLVMKRSRSVATIPQ